MEFYLGKTGERISSIGIGTWQMKSNDQSIMAIRAGLDAGSNFVDTAEAYRNEAMVGRAIESREVFIATKVFPNHFKYDSLIRACENSLKRLNVKTIDLYQLHWPNRHVDIKETMKAMEHLVDTGMIRYIGVSNFNVNELKSAMSAMSKYEIVSNQVEYNPLVRYIEPEISEFCRKNSISIIAYSPLMHGHDIDAISKDESPFNIIANKRNATVRQVILAWILSKNFFAIPKSNVPEHVIENVKSMNINLSSEETSMIDHYVSRFNKKSLKERYGNIISFVSRF
ncbi:aldo/keto reductase [Picrophilus oshimae]|uniref:NADP-dependent oxidoreductase domain-containing protein n=1 Tax=Picrophilus torridus (strain ATCC 700027 / DSM 9790 / JCM 10055 / NBRC 100828 / KAW 2/3) TaxID=1122961 RepID=A0A8G2FVT8_PICTO|nr:aldo/keto reductase [Picrophilus oshimae]SMD30379.1 hypothetical protein SAMN02745355_0258 [Picrophilus oshimae DSM 9789]